MHGPEGEKISQRSYKDEKLVIFTKGKDYDGKTGRQSTDDIVVVVTKSQRKTRSYEQASQQKSQSREKLAIPAEGTKIMEEIKLAKKVAKSETTFVKK